MKARFAYLAGIYIFWLVVFGLFKLVFLFYQHEISFELSPSEWLLSLWHGMYMDASMAAYLVAIPFFLVGFSALGAERVIAICLLGYHYLFIPLVMLGLVADLELYYAWGFHLDNTPFRYLQSPAEAMASMGASPWVLLLFIFTLGVALAGGLYYRVLHPMALKMPGIRFYWWPAFLVLTAALILPMRGGIQLAPMNQSAVYFSNTLFANEAAINPIWNLFYSLDNQNISTTNPYQFINQQDAQAIVKEAYQVADSTIAPTQWLKTERPHIVLIIWESFTAKATALGEKSYTPYFDSLISEGLLFNQLYASASRSDKGLVSILSGYPAQPKESIITLPNKSKKLPSLARSFRQNGYQTGFYYGGETEFANIKSYMTQSAFEQLIGKENFDSKDWNSKWGAHDEVVYGRLLHDINTQYSHNEAPFFLTLFTLSSHEPFEISGNRTFVSGTDEESQFLNAMAYSDWSLGQFVEAAKKEDWYANTLFIVIADHGHRLPQNHKNHEKEKYHIPMLWWGEPLLAKGDTVSGFFSQTDLAKTLLQQVAINASDYPWSRDMAHPKAKGFALYTFNDGFGLLTDSSYSAFDYKSKKPIPLSGNSSEQVLRFGRAHLQETYQDYLNK